MKTKRIRVNAKEASFFIAFVVLFFSSTPLQAQSSTAVEQIKTAIQQNIDHLDAGWDEASYILPINSSAYLKAKTSYNTVSYSMGIYSFKGNVKDAPSQRMADQRLKTLALLLRKATDEITDMYEQGTYDGELKQLKPLLKFIGYTVSNKPISLTKLDVRHSKVQSLTPRMLEHSTFRAEALTQEAEMLASSQWMAMNKHLAYKFLTAYILTVPMFWAYLEPEFFRLVSEGGASTDTIVYVKLHMNREPFILQDSRIWYKAPRFQASQLKLVEADAGSQTRYVKKVELSDTETRVTVRYNVRGREMWYRFDKTLALVDNETKELYPVIRMENNIPLGKTFIVVGCEGKAVEFTFVFPPLKKTLKQFVLNDNLSAPTSEKAKMRYFKKHNIMSDGSGRSPVVIYNLLEFTNTSASVPSSPSIASVPNGINGGNAVNRRVVTSSKPDGRTEEKTYVSDKLVSLTSYFPNGKVAYTYNYVNNALDGEAYTYYESGELMKKATYDTGKITAGVMYYETGEVKTTYRYKNGVLNGPTVSYSKSGKVTQETMLKDGLTHGTNKLYYENGNLRLVQNMANGKQNGELIEYDINGKVIRKEMYQDNKLVK